jgi:hypothetical protein
MKFMLLYRGPATPMDQIPPEQFEQIMQGWYDWRDKLGSGLVDFGTPFASGSEVRGDGSTGPAGDLHGYTVVEAADIDEARSLCDAHPFLSDRTAKFAVEIYELAPIEM